MNAEPLMPITDLWNNGWMAKELRDDGWILTIDAHGRPFEFDWVLSRNDDSTVLVHSKHSAKSRQKALRDAYNTVTDKKLWRSEK